MRCIYVFMTAATCAALTLTVALVPQLNSAYLAPELGIAFATAALLIALLTGCLAVGRFLRRPRLTELTLACSLGTFVVSELVFVAIPPLSKPIREEMTAWFVLGSAGVGAGLFALAAFIPGRKVLQPAKAMAEGAALVTAVLVITVAVSCATDLPELHLAATGHRPLSRPDPAANSGLLALELAMAAIYVLAGLGFLRRFKRRRDEFSGWLAIAAVLGAAASFNYLLFPNLNFRSVLLGDVFYLGFFVALLTGSARELLSYWRALSAHSVFEERQRIAHDLHDGLAQELAYLLRNLDSLDGGVNGDTKARLRDAAKRAQAEAWMAISTLGAPGRQAVNVAIGQAVGEVAARDRIKVELDVLPQIQLPSARAEALTRIACEAVGNAARHSGAEQVRLSLRHRGTRVQLCVTDNGKGFDVAAPSNSFGLTSMRKRASSVGGNLCISSEPGRGTEVKAVL